MQVEADLRTLRLLARLVGFAFPGHEYAWLLPEFETTLRAELDFRREARNAARTAAFFAAEPSVHVPVTLPRLSGERVLTMEWIDGVKLTDGAALQAAGTAQAPAHRWALAGAGIRAVTVGQDFRSQNSDVLTRGPDLTSVIAAAPWSFRQVACFPQC